MSTHMLADNVSDRSLIVTSVQSMLDQINYVICWRSLCRLIEVISEMKKLYDTEIDVFIEDVVNFGSHYQLDEMERLYTQDQSILFVSGTREVVRVSRSDMLNEFRARRQSGDSPLSTGHEVLHVEQQGDHATAILFRRMSPDHPPALYELRLRKESSGWMVAGETVVAWPSEADAGDFLPPRQS